MNRQTTKPRIAVVVAVATLLTDAAAGVLLVAEGSFRGDVISNVVMMVAVVCYAVVGALIARRLPRNVCGWLLLSIGLGVAVTLCTDAGSVLAQRSGQLGLATWLLWLNSWVLIPTAWVGIVWFFLVFPSGSPPSRRWRRFLTGLIGVGLIGVTAAMVQRWDDDVLTNPLALPGPLAGTVFAGVAAGFGVALIISAGSVVRRLRCGGSQDRLALRWLAVVGVLAATLLVTAIAAGVVGFHRLGDPLGVGFLIVLILGLPASAAVALLMNRVSGIEVVAYRSVVYGSILSTITVLYAVLVGGVGAVVGRSERSDTLTAVAATAGTAVAFQPVRRRAQTFASRLVYGDRASPYELVATFSERLEDASLADVLPRMTALIAQGTGADRVWIWLRNDDELRRVAAWPPDDASGVTAPLVQGDRPVIGDPVFPVRHRGELLGAITIGMPPQEPLTPSTARLLTDLSTQAGLVLRNVVLVQELKESRTRLVSSHDEARRRLERDLHDGAQQRLVTLSMDLRTARDRAEATGDAGLTAQLEATHQELIRSLAELRELARGLHPVILTQSGVGAAVRSLADRSTVPVRLGPITGERFPPDVEATAYFVVSEALTNIAKHAAASCAWITIVHTNGRLAIDVGDDGVGGATPRSGSGLRGLADRVEAIGGQLHICNEPGEGSTVHVEMPCALR